MKYSVVIFLVYVLGLTIQAGAFSVLKEEERVMVTTTEYIVALLLWPLNIFIFFYAYLLGKVNKFFHGDAID